MKTDELIDWNELPKLPEVEGLKRHDHVTFVALPQHEKDFFNYWNTKGFSLLQTLQTINYPARHTGLVKEIGAGSSVEPMIGLSVPAIEDSPITKFLLLYGTHRLSEKSLLPGKFQHIAYEVDIKRSMEEVCEELERAGVQFMTPILRYDNSPGERLEQRFVACKKPFGPFIEIIRRTLKRDGLDEQGKPYQGFATKQIDELYKYYDQYSRKSF